MSPPLVVIGGPSGAGKTTVGQLLASDLCLPFCDADDLHSAENIARMSAGTALDDEARALWLVRVGSWLAEHEEEGGVVACSALARRYRDVLRRAAPRVKIALLLLDFDELVLRLDQRQGHFMGSTLLSTQLATYEPPGTGEQSTEFDAGGEPGITLRRISEWLVNDDACAGDPGRGAPPRTP